MSVYWKRAFNTPLSIEDRLRAISYEHVISFAAGCAEHAIEHFTEVFEMAGVDGHAVSPFFGRCKVARQCCWDAVKGQRDEQAIDDAITQLDKLFEEVEWLERAIESGAHNIDQITAAVYKALQCTKDDTNEMCAIGAANCAYNSTLQWYVMGTGETVEWTDHESEKQQRKCEQCQTEITFQKSYLRALETLIHNVPTYKNVLSKMK